MASWYTSRCTNTAYTREKVNEYSFIIQFPHLRRSNSFMTTCLGGEGGIRTHGAWEPHKISSLGRYDHFGTSPWCKHDSHEWCLLDFHSLCPTCQRTIEFIELNGGEGGIRTHGSARDTQDFKSRPLWPLRHLTIFQRTLYNNIEFFLYNFTCRCGRNRTHIGGFGDRCPTIERRTYIESPARFELAKR